MKTIISKLFVFAVVVGILPFGLSAQSELQLPEKYLDESCFGYVYVDLEHANLEDISKVMEELFGQNSLRVADLKNQTALAIKNKRQLLEAGAKNIYVVLSADDIMSGGPFVFVPTPTPGSSENVSRILNEKLSGASTVINSVDGGVLCCNRTTERRIGKQSLPSRHDASELLALHTGSHIAVILLPSNDQKKVIREVLPSLPSPWTKLTGDLLVDGAQSIVIKLNSDEIVEIDFVIKGKDAESSQRLGIQLNDLKSMIVKRQVVIPGLFSEPIAELLSSLSMNQEDELITSRIKFDGATVASMRVALGPALLAFDRQRELNELRNKVRELVIATHNYHDHQKHMPGVASFDAEGNPLLSWRVLILPYIEENHLYAEFKLDEPWDSEHNIKLLAKMPAVFNIDRELAKEGKTTLLMPTGAEVAGRNEGLKLQEFSDGTSRTVLIANVVNELAVPWTQPVDWAVELDNMKAALEQLRLSEEGNSMLGYADGSVHQEALTLKKLRAILTVDGGDWFVED